MTKKYIVSLESLRRWAELYPNMTIVDFIEFILK